MGLIDLNKERELFLKRRRNQLLKENKLSLYDPYPYQVKFHNDKDKRKCLRAGNQQGKTLCGTAQDAMDLTGRYPDWYKGREYDHPIRLMCGGLTNEKTRDLLQKALLGNPIEKETSLGTGWIPKDCLDPKKLSLKRGVTDAYAHAMVKHHTDGVFDGWSILSFSSYVAGKEAWMGDTIDIYHPDEEPPMDILGQMGRGCIATKGSIRMTFTPEKGTTDVVDKVEREWSLHMANWSDVAGEHIEYVFEDGEVLTLDPVRTLNGNLGHINQETINQAEKDFPPFLMKMRMLGLPVAGEGLVFSFMESQISCDPIQFPDYFEFLDALDFGGLSSTAHPTAFVRLARDPTTDIIYIYDGFRVVGKEIPEIATLIKMKPNSDIIKVAWPHDGNKVTGQDGTTKEQYVSAGVNMCETHFTNPPETNKEEGKGGILIMPGITEMSSRFHGGLLKVFNTVVDFFIEYRAYHMKDGKIVDRKDDFMSASRVGVMYIRHATTLERKKKKLQTIPRGHSWLS